MTEMTFEARDFLSEWVFLAIHGVDGESEVYADEIVDNVNFEDMELDEMKRLLRFLTRKEDYWRKKFNKEDVTAVDNFVYRLKESIFNRE